MREAIIASMPCDYNTVSQALNSPIPDGKAIWYLKQMTHHMAADDDLTWAKTHRNAFLIRDPRAVVASYAAKRENPTDFDIGIKRQVEVFQAICQITGTRPPVIDSAQVLHNPKAALSALCAAMDVPFDDAMLSWSAGKRATDGIWAAHWYGVVEGSTAFAPSKPLPAPMPDELEALAEDSRAAYEHMSQYCLEVS